MGIKRNIKTSEAFEIFNTLPKNIRWDIHQFITEPSSYQSQNARLKGVLFGYFLAMGDEAFKEHIKNNYLSTAGGIDL